MKLKYPLITGLLILCQFVFCQKNVSITIDDVPNTTLFEKDNYQSILLEKLDSLKIPIAIFINEGLIYKTDSITKNFELLISWSQKEFITLGNHSFNHYRYSDIGIDLFKNEITNGAAISREFSKKHNKPLTYFRFPFNDLGQDSLQHLQVKEFLKEEGYIITPFTIESSDWMYNFVYEYYLDQKDFTKAAEIGEAYLTKTIEYFDFFETLSQADYHRSINQIYLCHDNKLNTDFLPKIVTELKKKGYQFISLEKALTDKVYEQKDNYFKKWGISWLYRWKGSQKERFKLMKQEPSTEKIEVLYKNSVEKRKISK